MRVLGQLIVGNVFGQLLLMSIPGPEDLNGLNLLLLADLLAPLATAIGNLQLFNKRDGWNKRDGRKNFPCLLFNVECFIIPN